MRSNEQPDGGEQKEAARALRQPSPYTKRAARKLPPFASYSGGKRRYEVFLSAAINACSIREYCSSVAVNDLR